MLTRTERTSNALVLFLVLTGLLLSACGGEEAPEDAGLSPVAHPVLGEFEEAALDAAGVLEDRVPEALAGRMKLMLDAAARAASPAALTVDYPLDGSVFPPEFIAPSFLWHDPDPNADLWLIRIDFSDETAKPITVLVPGAPPPQGEIDLEAVSATNEIYEGTEYQKSAVSWTPSGALWMEIKRRSSEAPATITFSGFTSRTLEIARSRGSVKITASFNPACTAVARAKVLPLPGRPDRREDVPWRAVL